jgi:putative addiction module killer protein
MIPIRQTEMFSEWMRKLRDLRVRSIIQARIDRLASGNPGDVKPVGEGVSELRISHGPGYRVYFVQSGKVFILLLCGGDKSSQSADIRRAKMMAAELEKE